MYEWTGFHKQTHVQRHGNSYADYLMKIKFSDSTSGVSATLFSAITFSDVRFELPAQKFEFFDVFVNVIGLTVCKFQ